MVNEKVNHSLNRLEDLSIENLVLDFTEIVCKFRVESNFNYVDFAENVESFFEDYNVKLRKKFPFFNFQKRIYVWSAYDGIGICPGRNWAVDFERESQSDIELMGMGSDKNNSFSVFENSNGKRFTVYKNYTKKSQ